MVVEWWQFKWDGNGMEERDVVEVVIEMGWKRGMLLRWL